MDRLLHVALEEALLWLPVPLRAEAMNAGTCDRHIWQTVSQEARFGSVPSTTSPSQVVTTESVLPQPDLPASAEEARHMLMPDTGVRALRGYRRRAWQQAVGSQDDGRDSQETVRLPEEDRTLYIVQGNDDQSVGNWPAGVDRPEHPVRDLPGRGAGDARRRGSRPRPRPRWPSASEMSAGMGVHVREPLRRRRVARGSSVGDARERSRSRDAE